MDEQPRPDRNTVDRHRKNTERENFDFNNEFKIVVLKAVWQMLIMQLVLLLIQERCILFPYGS